LSKKLFVVAATGLIISLAGSTPAHNKEKENQPGQRVERSVAVEPQATITLCVASGTLTVRGWDKAEVRVRSLDAQVLELRRIDKPKDPNTPANRIDVMVLEKAARIMPARIDCQAIADVEMEVPAGATVQVQTRDGDINIAGVAAAYAGSQNGDITIERATRLIEAGSVGGSISLKNSTGRVNLSSAGGGVEAINVRAASADDTFEVGTVSGDIQLLGITNPKVMAKTVSGTLTMSGALVKSGSYAFTNMTGDVVLERPHDASFRLAAKVSEKRLLVSEFTLKYLSEPTPPPPAPPAAAAGGVRTPKPPDAKEKPAIKDSKTPAPKAKEKPAAKAPAPAPDVSAVISGPVVVITKPPMVVAPYVRRIDAICGSGDALISVASFGGTVQLKKL
jgi:hypothetical protein